MGFLTFSFCYFIVSGYKCKRFCPLILDYATSINLLARSSSPCHPQTMTNNSLSQKIVFFSNLYIFYFFFFSDYMVRTSKTMLNKSGKGAHHCLVPDLRRNTLFFTIENDICCGFVVNIFHYVELGSLYACFLDSFVCVCVCVCFNNE